MKKSKILFFLLFLSTIFSLSAQNSSNVLIKLDQLPSDISKEDLEGYQKKLSNLSANESFEFIRFKDLDQLKVTHQVTLKVPDATELHTFKEQYTEYTNDEDFYWSGEDENDPRYRVELFVLCGYISGKLEWSDKVYVINLLSPKYHLLTAYNRSDIKSGCGTGPSIENSNPTPCTPNNESCTIDVLVVYPSSLLTLYSKSELTTLARKSIIQVNEAFPTSKIKHKVRLAGGEAFELPDVWPFQITVDAIIEEAIYINELLTKVPTSNTAMLRAQIGGDLVVVLTD